MLLLLRYSQRAVEGAVTNRSWVGSEHSKEGQFTPVERDALEALRFSECEFQLLVPLVKRVSLFSLALQLTKLEKLGTQYGVTISFLPKYHCELSSIEGMWCNMKAYVRKHSEQNFSKMVQLNSRSPEAFRREANRSQAFTSLLESDSCLPFRARVQGCVETFFLLSVCRYYSKPQKDYQHKLGRLSPWYLLG